MMGWGLLGGADPEATCNASLALRIVKAASTQGISRRRSSCHRLGVGGGLTSITRCNIGCSHSTFTSQ